MFREIGDTLRGQAHLNMLELRRLPPGPALAPKLLATMRLFLDAGDAYEKQEYG